MLHQTKITSSLIALLTLSSCADSLAKRLDNQSDPGAGGTAHGDGDPDVVGEIITADIDASSQTETVYFDFDLGRVVTRADGWDLSFRRFHVQMNGGVSGDGGVQALIAEDVSFEDLEQAPDDGYSSDRGDGDGDDDSDPDNIFNNGERDWYDYDVATHALTSKKLSYVIASSESKLYKFVIDDYYDAAGSPAVLRVRWARLAGPAPEPADSEAPDSKGDAPDQVTGASTSSDAGVAAPADAAASVSDASTANDVDAATTPDAVPDAGAAPTPTVELTVSAGSSTEWIYVSADGKLVAPADPAHSLEWDIAFKRTELRSNSGQSGIGRGGAKREERALSFAQIAEADTFDFSVDQEFNSGAPGATTVSQNTVLGDWYDYNPMNHSVTPSDLSFIVRTARGDHAKLRILSWKDGVYTISIGPIARTRAVRELEVDASANDSWRYVSLSRGANVDVSDPGTALDWDLAIQRTSLRSNGGSSGSGMAAAAEVAGENLAALGAIPAAFTSDAVSNAMGSELSSNAALSGWYNYDANTHVVSPRAVAYVVRTAAGDLGALKILSYASGVYRIALSYAGPNATTLD